MNKTFFQKLITTTALSLILSGCGGGGGVATGQSVNLNGGGTNVGNGNTNTNNGNSNSGSNGNNTANLTARSISDFLTSNEYNRTSTYGGSTGLAQINAASAYAMGASGAGITIAAIDTGIDTTNSEFVGALSNASINIVNGLHDANSLNSSVNPHGTWVSGVLGARMNSDLTMGVAWGSTLMMIRADTISTTCPSGCFQAQDIAAGIRYAANNGAKIINMSFGATGSLGNMVTSAAAYAASKNVLMVAAAGNEGLAEVDSPANLGSQSGSNGYVLAVGAVDQNNVIASFSNRAGGAMDYYLVAPGTQVLTTDTPNGMALVAGTSFAAPMVSGAAALLMQYAPYLTAKQVATILLTTATDLGATGVDAIYGHGLLNVGAAVSPVGLTSIPTAGTSSTAQGTAQAAAHGQAAAVNSSYVAMSAAFGNALSNNATLKQGIMVDSFGRAYGMDMSNRIVKSRYTSGMMSFIASRDNTTSSVMSFGERGMASFGFTAANTSHQVTDLKDKGRINGDTTLALSTQASDNVTVGYSHGHSLAQSFGFAETASRAADSTAKGDMFDNAFLSLVEGGNAATTGIDLGHGLALTLGGGSEDGKTSLTSTDNNDGTRAGYAAELTFKQGGFKLGLQAGQVKEGTSSLSSQSDGALAFGQGSTTNFVALNATIPLMQGLALAGTYQFGMTQIGNSATSMLSDFSRVRSDKFALALMADDVVEAGDRLTLAVSQPLRVNGGSAMLTVPTGVMEDGTIINSNQRVGLSPTGRQTDVSLGYNFAVGNKQTLGVSTVSTFNPANDSKASMAVAVGVRYTKVF